MKIMYFTINKTSHTVTLLVKFISTKMPSLNLPLYHYYIIVQSDNVKNVEIGC